MLWWFQDGKTIDLPCGYPEFRLYIESRVTHIKGKLLIKLVFHGPCTIECRTYCSQYSANRGTKRFIKRERCELRFRKKEGVL